MSEANECLTMEVADFIQRFERDPIRRRRAAEDILAHIAKALGTVTPEMVDAWENASTDWNDQMPPEQFETACCQANWSAMLAASALTPTPTEPK